MNDKWQSLTFKLWLTIITAIILSVLFAYSLSQYYYKNLYVEKLKTDLVNEASLLGADYTGGEISDDFKEKVEWFNSKNESEVFVVNSPRELSACLPFEINYDTLISEEERQMLLDGRAVEKEGYEKRFGKNIVAAIIPLIDDEDRLEGIIYTYIPVDSITDLLKEFAAKWLLAILLFLIIAIFLTTKWLKKLVSPIKEIETAAHRVSEGDYDIQLQVKSHDEIGKLAQAFNDMANSIHLEEGRKKEFLENVAHELRTPLSYVKGYTHAILDGVVKNEEEERKYLQLISREALRLQRIVGDLMDLSKVDGDSFDSSKTPIAFAQFIEDVLSKYEPIIKAKQLNLAYELDPDPILYGDEGRMEQILHNIIDNAVQYTNPGGSIQIRLVQYNEECELSISDTGIGIPKADLPYIMNRFYRVNKARSRFDGGSGLGLSIVKKMVEWQQGRIEIQSKEKIGTKVKIWLPTIKEE
ncbi:HAMP domain-containing sensor histidine kinase [Peribacillus sp. SI8-4]|uniref:sensor histidine kinase n=1 Tax=Peribacillus sp. SI8-4 TaxID=3048009 RepID=UPI0025537469|nr:HAMP domain-containing sensor histidine kinase [Peribacillus sp. SI8-4]